MIRDDRTHVHIVLDLTHPYQRALDEALTLTHRRGLTKQLILRCIHALVPMGPPETMRQRIEEICDYLPQVKLVPRVIEAVAAPDPEPEEEDGPINLLGDQRKEGLFSF